jgi:hypothetical protein
MHRGRTFAVELDAKELRSKIGFTRQALNYSKPNEYILRAYFQRKNPFTYTPQG